MSTGNPKKSLNHSGTDSLELSFGGGYRIILPATLEEVLAGEAEEFPIAPSRGPCSACGVGSVLTVPAIPGLYCSVRCIETYLFGTDRCRWCGNSMEKRPYTSIDSRLCSEDCSENYYAHVRGDRTAALGKGKRLLLWLQAHQPETYRILVGMDAANEGSCHNPGCKRGENGMPASLAHLRTGTLYCSTACKMQMRRAA
jgi:hypothetical protein